MKKITELIDKLISKHDLTDEELLYIIKFDEDVGCLHSAADKVRRSVYGNKVYIRGLIEFTNYCKNNCLYCGIRHANKDAIRYRLSKEEILTCCKEGYDLGFRTFVLQGGEDEYYTDEIICDIVASIRKSFTDCAITLSIGEKSKESYKSYFDAGANRYLLRHETADYSHYEMLHPKSMKNEIRKKCLFDLKEIGYQVGSGFMVGSPYQTAENVLADLRFLQELQPDMIGIGPFIPHANTPLGQFPAGKVQLTLKLISILRLMFPYALIPATTALGSILPGGREEGLKAGANVVMPNLSPTRVRNLYEIYENKLSSGAEAAESLNELKNSVEACGYSVVTDIGNVKKL